MKMKISKKKNLNKYVNTIMKKKATMIWIFIIIPKKHSKPNKNSLGYLVAKKIKSPIGKHITNNYKRTQSKTSFGHFIGNKAHSQNNRL